jgi:Co/Zn/Cd efflux system component
MGYMNLIMGIVLLAIFTWILLRNSRRSGFIHTLFRIDTIAGMTAGLYLIVTSVYLLLGQ